LFISSILAIGLKCMNQCLAVVVLLMLTWTVHAADARKPGSDPAIRSLNGKEVYVQSCAMCHSSGAGGAPRPGTGDEWKERARRGPAELMVSVLRGKGGMPPKGGNASLTRVEAYLALDYMLNGEK
jgi:cytochrome c5